MQTDLNIIITSLNHLLFTNEINTINDLKSKINMILKTNGCTTEQHQQIIDAYNLGSYKTKQKINIKLALQLMWNTYQNDCITLFDYTYTLVIIASCNPSLCNRINTEFDNNNIKWREVMQQALNKQNNFNWFLTISNILIYHLTK